MIPEVECFTWNTMENRPEHFNILENGAKQFGISLSREMLDKLLFYVQELKEWNTRFNLTAITTDNEILVKHLLDSLAPCSYLPEGASVIDIGSGAGIPGIPIKIARPDIRVTLLDSSRKKIHFQKHVIRTLGLSHIRTIQARAEHAIERYPDMGSYYDVALSRAFSSLRVFIQFGKPFLKKNGLLIAFKGPAAATEFLRLKAWLDQESVTIKTLQYRLPFLEQKRTLYLSTFS